MGLKISWRGARFPPIFSKSFPFFSRQELNARPDCSKIFVDTLHLCRWLLFMTNGQFKRFYYSLSTFHLSVYIFTIPARSFYRLPSYGLKGETILGQPNQIHPLGVTQIPFSIFVDYVQGLADSTFRLGAVIAHHGAFSPLFRLFILRFFFCLLFHIARPDAYDLLRHNCNTFSNEIAQFLCGNSIPQHILDLPTEVLSTWDTLTLKIHTVHGSFRFWRKWSIF